MRVRPEAVHARAALGVGHQVDPRAPAEAAALVVARSGLHRDVEVELGQPLQLLRQDGLLPGALTRQRHVGELTATDAARTGRRPGGLDAVGRRVEDLDGVGPPELRGVAEVRQPRPDPLAGQRVPDEDDPPLVPRDAVPAVGDGPDLELDEGCGCQGQ